MSQVIKYCLLFLLAGFVFESFAQQPDTTKTGTIKIKKSNPDSARDKLIGKWGICINKKYSTTCKCEGHKLYYTFYKDGGYILSYPGVSRSDAGKWSYTNGILVLALDASTVYGSYELIWKDEDHFAFKKPEGKRFVYVYYEKLHDLKGKGSR